MVMNTYRDAVWTQGVHFIIFSWAPRVGETAVAGTGRK